MDPMVVEISPLTASDRAGWEVLARGFKAFFGAEISDEGYEQTWRRLLDGDQIRGIAARLDGRMVGIAHYFFHTTVWKGERCYLQDLFVDPETRGRGVARALIEWVAREAEQHGAVNVYWHTTQGNVTARALYDKVASGRDFVAYTRPVSVGP
jgi:GNAT superfamily N-acetyltransferase